MPDTKVNIHVPGNHLMTGLLGTHDELLRLVELPLAWPSMLAGIRVATVVAVGTATIAAAIGAGAV